MTVRVRLEGEAGLHLTVYVACRWSWPVGAGQALVLQRGASPNHADLLCDSRPSALACPLRWHPCPMAPYSLKISRLK